ncbi:MAG: hypothetical protein DCC55_27705 [Chloroflexi bacterium]|nr:MAG: hypothetical protein DCC55_27705 [Chloroflexota bacterium]
MTIDVRITDYAFELNQDRFTAGEFVVFHVVNAGEYPHEFAVFRLPEGATVDGIAQGQFPEESAFTGAIFALPGQEATDLVLVNLEAGTYAIVCFMDAPDGIPHVARGMVAGFTVQ